MKPLWRSPQALVEIGLSRSRVLMMNEAHDNMLRCIRTRNIGSQILASAHQAGVRYFALEALWKSHLIANETRKIALDKESYLSQADMRSMLQSALDLGWTLMSYEADTRLYLDSRGLNPDYQTYSLEAWQAIVFTDEYWQWREESAARALSDAFLALGDSAKMLVWVGWQHHARQPIFAIDIEQRQDAMGHYFEQMSQLSIFSIDQTVTILDDSTMQGWSDYTHAHAATLRDLGGTAGFLREECPPELRALAESQGHDAYILSLDNRMK